MQRRLMPGHGVWIRGTRWRLERAAVSQSVARLDVADRHGHRTFLLPYDRASFGERTDRPVRVRRPSGLARLAGLVAGRLSIRNVAAARNAAIDLHPYQFEAALAVLAGRRRVLLADEVGLGKTIQAGLAVAELLRRHPDARVLIVTPAGLVDQWTAELTRRFGVTARLADPSTVERPRDLRRFGDDPWRLPGVWVASPDYLKQPHVFDNLPRLAWDLVVVDEAHAAAGESARHRAVSAISRQARHVLLLTATPHSGHEGDFDRLMRLGALDHADDALLVLRRGRGDVGFATTRRVRWHRIRPHRAVRRLLDALTDFERLVSDTTDASRRHGAGLLASLLRRRASSTVAALVRSLERRASWLDASTGEALPDWAQPGLDFGDAETDDAVGESDRFALTSETALLPRDERGHVMRLLRLAGEAGRSEPKLTRLSALTARAREPLVVFTEFRDSLEAARHAFADRTIATLHGGLTAAERRTALAEFLDGRASVLLTTDVGGQGLNLQHRARWVVSLDLPWNPVRLEQRIGRVDRIGQTRTVHVTLLVLDDAGDDRIRNALTRRVRAARQVGAAPATLGDLDAESGAQVRESAPDSATHANTLRPMRTFARQARAVVRVIARDRALGVQWRGRDPRTRPWYVDTSGASRPSSGRTSLGFAVRIVAEDGRVVEDTGVVVVVSRRVDPRRLPKAVLDRARTLATTTMLRRLDRVRRLRRASTHETVEQALAAAVRAETRRAPAQLPLFTGAWQSRAARVADSDTGDRPDSRTGVQPQARLELARPELIWIWVD
jgi:superfamily II DNA or RNA helicase